ncbi:MAG: hypothetical protein ACRD5W_08705 [Candidatus Acidiferrales bacterium]
MRIDSNRLKNLIVEVAELKFAQRDFQRRPLMGAVEAELRNRGLWTKADDSLSGSVGLKSEAWHKLTTEFRILSAKDGS